MSDPDAEIDALVAGLKERLEPVARQRGRSVVGAKWETFNLDHELGVLVSLADGARHAARYDFGCFRESWPREEVDAAVVGMEEPFSEWVNLLPALEPV